MTHPDSAELLQQLSRNSTPYQDPLARVSWERLDAGMFWLPESALSLYGLPEYESLSIAQRRTLSHYEFLNFIEAGLWLESLFMERIGRSLRLPAPDVAHLAYRLHELREEAGHSLMFLELVQRAGLPFPQRRVRGHRLSDLIGRHAPYDSLLFWMAVLIGEEVPDRMNRFVRKHADEICPAIHDIATIHVMDEARHIAHARDLLERRLPGLSRAGRWLLTPMLRLCFRQFVRLFYFPQAHIYELAGILPGRYWVTLARRNPHRAAFVDNCVGTTLRVLRERGIALDWK